MLSWICSHQLDDEVPSQKDAEWPKLGMDAVEPECEYIKIEEHPVLPHFLDPGQPKVDVSCEGTIESQSGNQLQTNKQPEVDVSCG